jgi:hypothetical protein
MELPKIMSLKHLTYNVFKCVRLLSGGKGSSDPFKSLILLHIKFNKEYSNSNAIPSENDL